MSALESAQENRPQAEWEISTALDIRLGEYFTANSHLKNTYLEVDHESIETCLRELGPGNPGTHKLHFELTHPDNLEDRCAAHCYGTDEAGHRVSVLARHSKVDTFHCEIGVSAEDLQIIDNYLPAFPSRTSIDIAPRKVLPLTGWLQETAQHELQHAVDYSQSELRKKQSRYQYKALGGLAAYSVLTIGGQVAIAEIAVSAVDAHQSAAIFAPAILLCITMNPLLKRAVKYVNTEFDLNSPLEKQAYAAESDYLPTVISLNYPDLR